MSIRIEALHPSPAIVAALAGLLIDVVAAGGSVSFMHPLDPDVANAFWNDSLAAAARGERIVLGAWDDTTLAGTVTVLLRMPPNQPHRAELAKMMTRPGQRGLGIGSALAREAERLAAAYRKTLLVLDTASDGGASTMYERLGFSFAGEIPDFALKPHGGLSATRLYWKRIGVIDGSADAGDADAG